MRNLVVISLLSLLASVGAETPSGTDTSGADFRLSDGLQIELFASDPNIAKPIQMNFDSRGRLWLVTSESYPQLEPGAEPRDKIYVLEDTDKDGKADKTTTFADGLRIPTGIEISPQGAFVGNATELLHLADRDGDGRADTRDISMTAFGTEDTHHLIHTFRYAPWGNLFFAQAVYIHSHVETPFGTKRLNGGGYWEYNPRTHRLEVFVTGMTNSWGLAFDPFGQAFGVDNDGYSVNFFPPGAHMIRTPNESHLYPSLVEGKPKYCGAEFVGTPAFPDDWQGNLLTCDFRAHRIARYRIEESGAGFKAEELPEVLSTADVSFRPVDVKFGPDGSLYVCDWFNPIINHGEVDFRDPRRDKTHGRIWRISHRDRRSEREQSLADATMDSQTSLADLISKQKSASEFARHFARREMAARPADEVHAALDAWVASETDELLRLRAMWCYESAGTFNDELLQSLLEAKDHRVRAAAVRAVGRNGYGRWEQQQRRVMMALKDEHPRVRTEGVRLLDHFRFAQMMAWALSALDRGTDPTLEYAIKQLARESTSAWLFTAKRGELGRQPLDRWVMAILAVDRPDVVPILLDFLRVENVPDELSILAFIGKHGSPEQMGVLLEQARRTGMKPEKRAKILSALINAHRLRQAKPTGDLERPVRQWLASDDDTTRDQAIRLAGLWKIESLRPVLIEKAESTSKIERESAIDALRQLGGSASSESLAGLFSRSQEPSTRLLIATALVSIDAPRAIETILPAITASTDGAEGGSLVQAFLGSQQGPIQLAAALAGKKLSAAVAEESVKRINASGQTMPALIKALRVAGGLPEGERMVSPQQIAALADKVMRSGDPQRGQQVYARKELACATCHVIKGAGGKVGPELTTIGTSAPVDYLVESLLLPSSKVKENYHSVVLVTDDGKVVTGIPEQQNESEIVLRLADNTTVSIPKARVEETKMGGSLMPTDVVDTLPTQDLLDLVRYLAELGKPGPFGPAEEQSARRWRILGPVTLDQGTALLPKMLDGTLEASAWTESLTTNDAWVYVRELSLSPEKPTFFGTTTISVTRPGKIRLTIRPGRKATYWLDGKPLEVKQVADEESVADVELTEGKHSFLAKVDLSKIPSILRLRAYTLGDLARFELEKP
ncbi:c-type cytochrome [bacterium]|nr:c-type cytochrome [bacterium]